MRRVLFDATEFLINCISNDIYKYEFIPFTIHISRNHPEEMGGTMARWGHFGVFLVPLGVHWGPLGVISGSFVVPLGHHSGPLGFILGSFRPKGSLCGN